MIAKSLRSKAKVHNRKFKREDPKNDFRKTDLARTERVSNRLQEGASRPTVTQQEKERQLAKGDDAEMESEPDQQEEEQQEAAGDDAMDEGDDKQPKKISTHGPKASGRAEYKRRKGFKERRGKATTDFRISNGRRRRDGQRLFLFASALLLANVVWLLQAAQNLRLGGSALRLSRCFGFQCRASFMELCL